MNPVMSKTSQQEHSAQDRSRRARVDMRNREHSIRARSCVRDSPRFGGFLALLALVSGGCRQDIEQQRELDAIDVAPALQIGTENDQTAVERPASLVGVLPQDFPDDLSLYLPASLVDFGTVGDGSVFVSLLTPHAPARVEQELTARLAQDGWSTATAGGDKILRKGNRRVRLRLEDARPGTRYRFEY